jgi:hypothetical protein
VALPSLSSINLAALPCTPCLLDQFFDHDPQVGTTTLLSRHWMLRPLGSLIVLSRNRVSEMFLNILSPKIISSRILKSFSCVDTSLKVGYTDTKWAVYCCLRKLVSLWLNQAILAFIIFSKESKVPRKMWP